MKKIFIPVCLFVFSACANNPQSSDSGNSLQTGEGGSIILPEDSPILQRIKIQKAETLDYHAAFTASGTVKSVPSKYAEVGTPFAGRITKSFVHLGQKVSVGSPLFEISSPDFFEAGKVYYQAKQEMELAQKNLKRENDLLNNNVGTVKDVEEAETNYELRKKDFEQALAALKVYQINPDDRTFGQPLIVRSPIDGEVLKNSIVIGQYMKEDTDPLIILADLNKVWVMAHVKEKDIPLLRTIAGVEIILPVFPDNPPVKGTIYYISELLDEETRSVEVIIECDNRDRLMKPFMYATVKMTAVPIRTVIIPNSAVLQDENGRYVLVSEGQNRFRKTDVKIISTDEKQTVVQSGISADDSIVTEGAFHFIDAR